jgi:hypothetical protein
MRARCFPCIGREHYRISLSPIIAYSDGVKPILPNTPVLGWSILTTIENFVQQERPQCGGTLRSSMQDALGRKAIHAALRSLTNICSGLLDCEAESVRYVFGRVKARP